MKRVKEYNYQCPFLLTHILAKLMLRITRKSCHFLPKVLPHRLIHANWLVWRNEAKRAKKATLCLCSGSKCGQPACSERSSLLYPCGKPFGRKRQTFPVIGKMQRKDIRQTRNFNRQTTRKESSMFIDQNTRE